MCTFKHWINYVFPQYDYKEYEHFTLLTDSAPALCVINFSIRAVDLLWYSVCVKSYKWTVLTWALMECNCTNTSCIATGQNMSDVFSAVCVGLIACARYSMGAKYTRMWAQQTEAVYGGPYNTASQHNRMSGCRLHWSWIFASVVPRLVRLLISGWVKCALNEY